MKGPIRARGEGCEKLIDKMEVLNIYICYIYIYIYEN